MAKEVLMPKLGLTMTEGTIEEWKYSEGDTVKQGTVLFSVATDKLVNDVEAEADGVLLKILLPAGETAECKSVVAYLGEAGETVPGIPAAPAPAPAPIAPQAPAASQPVVVAPQAPAASAAGRVRISPYARRTAAELGVDVSTLTGTGPNGRIVWRDVDAAAKAPAPTAAAALAGLTATADVTELLAGLATLDGALTLSAFAARAAAKMAPFPVVLRDLGPDIAGGFLALQAGESAVLTLGAPQAGRLTLWLVYDPAQVADQAAADGLRAIRAALESPLTLLA